MVQGELEVVEVEPSLEVQEALAWVLPSLEVEAFEEVEEASLEEGASALVEALLARVVPPCHPFLDVASLSWEVQGVAVEALLLP